VSRSSGAGRCSQLDLVPVYALRGLEAAEMQSAAAHISGCADCKQELESLRPALEALAGCRAEILTPPLLLWEQLLERIGADPAGSQPKAAWREPDWEEVAPGICCKLLSTDTQRDRVSMLVRLAPATEYPPHRHGGVEELHLLSGELWIDERKLEPGDYNRAEPGTADKLVWSATGCTCLLITSPADVLG